MRATPCRSILACTLALALASPASALAAAPAKSSKAAKGDGAAGGKGAETGDPSAPADGSPRVGRIFVDADGLGAAGPVLAGRAMRAATSGLEAQSVKITDAPAGPELRVKLTVREAGGYRVEYEIVYDGETVRDGTGGFDCQLCTEDELVDKVEALAIQVAPRLVVPEPEEDVGPGPADPGGKTHPDGKDDPTPVVVDGDDDGLGVKGKAGVALLVVGGLAAIGGVPLLAIEPIPVKDDPEMATQARNTKPLGGAMLGAGVAVLVTGAVLLALDRKQAKAKRKKAAAMLHPWLGTHGGGVTVVGRF